MNTGLIHFFTAFKRTECGSLILFLPKHIQVNHWHQHFTYVTKKTQSPTIKITFNYAPFILYTPGSLSEVANKPEPNRYVRERKGSSSPTAKRGVPQLSCQPLLPNQAEAWDSVVGQGRGTAHLPSPLQAEREDSKAGRAGGARPRCTALCPRERLRLLPLHHASSPSWKDGWDAASTANCWSGTGSHWSLHMVLNALLASQSFRYAEVIVINFRVNSSTATLPVTSSKFLWGKK